MFDIATSELVVLGAVALLVIPPKDLPKAMRIAGHWLGRVRGVASQFRSGFDSIVREAELQDMEKRWAEENERIMRDHPPTGAQMLPMTGTPADVGLDDASADAAPALVAPPQIAAPPSVATDNDHAKATQ